ncbi:MAG: tetratricopeptide repeat protein [Deltaproteobacteria bacterium]|nr:tetratricopeptide repeat protein [Deltaproteobacteria bacterium]
MSLINEYQSIVTKKEHNNEPERASVPPALTHESDRKHFTYLIASVTGVAALIALGLLLFFRPSVPPAVVATTAAPPLTASPPPVVAKPVASSVELAARHALVVARTGTADKHLAVNNKLLGDILAELKTIKVKAALHNAASILGRLGVGGPEPEARRSYAVAGTTGLAKLPLPPAASPLMIVGSTAPPGSKVLDATRAIKEKIKGGGMAAVAAAVASDKIDRIYQIALIDQRKGRWQEAKSYYEQVLRQRPYFKDTLVNLSAISIRMGQLQKAAGYVKQALAKEPTNSRALVNQGIIALRRKDIDSAASSFKKALASDPQQESALINLAFVAGQRHDAVAQEEYLKKLLALNPNNDKAHLIYASLLEKHGRLAEAVEQYRQCLSIAKVRTDSRLSHRIRQRIVLLTRM